MPNPRTARALEAFRRSCVDRTAIPQPITDGPVAGHVSPDPVPREPGPIAFDRESLPTVLRRRSPAEVRDHHLSHARAHLVALGLPAVWVDTMMDEASRMAEVGE